MSQLKDDEGELLIAVTLKDDNIVIDFGKPTAWIGLHKEETLRLIATLQQKLFQMTSTEEKADLLSRIYIRAQEEKGNWESLSLKELLDRKLDNEIIKWFMGKVLQLAEKSERLTVENVSLLVQILSSLGATIYQIKKEVNNEQNP